MKKKKLDDKVAQLRLQHLETKNPVDALIESAKIGGEVGVAQITKLIKSGVDINAKEKSFYGRTSLMWAVSRGHKDIASLLIESKADIEICDNLQSNALMYAAREGHVACVDLLLTNHCNVHLQDKEGRSALLWAAWSGHSQIVKNLMKLRAKIDVRDRMGKSITDYVTNLKDDTAELMFFAIVQELLEIHISWDASTIIVTYLNVQGLALK